MLIMKSKGLKLALEVPQNFTQRAFIESAFVFINLKFSMSSSD